MISEMRIERFKCFSDQTISFGNISVLTGNNGTGKSTVIQALLLLKQAYDIGSIETQIPLNGDLAKIGTAADALFVGSQEDTMIFTLVYREYPKQKYIWNLIYDKEAPNRHFMNCSFHTLLDSSGPFIPPMTYLMAERWGPRLTYPMSELPREKMNVGPAGEFTPHCLAEFGQDPIPNPELALENEQGSTILTLENQTQLWMRTLVPGVSFNVESIIKADRVRMETRFFDETPKYLRPTNVGFGVSYSLPIVVASLMADNKTILIVENPEAHLHPASQSKIGYFLARASVFGLQVIIETHSDHVLNGVRVAVKEGVIPQDDASILFFVRGGKLEGNTVINPRMHRDGGIDQWPKGFFDQYEQDLDKLI